MPVGILALAVTPFIIRESRDQRDQAFDIPGAVLVTSGLVLLVLGITQGQDWGWSSARVIGVFVASAALLLAFVGWESRQRDPLMPFTFFKHRTRTAANVAGFILGTVLFSMFLLLTLYMQQVLGYSAMKTGVAYLAVAGTAVLWANVAAVVVNRVGVKPALIFGMTLLTIGLVYFTQVSVDGSYWADLFPGFLIIGLGMPFCFVPITIAAMAGTTVTDAGLGSGLINTSQQIGGALGIAVLSSIATSVASDAIASGTAQPVALVDGFADAFWVGAAIALVGVFVSVFLVRRSELEPQMVGEPALGPA